jgi:hypothetical protein
MDLLVKALVFLAVNLIWLLISTPVANAYSQANLMNTGKVLATIGAWVAVTLTVILVSAEVILYVA